MAAEYMDVSLIFQCVKKYTRKPAKVGGSQVRRDAPSSIKADDFKSKAKMPWKLTYALQRDVLVHTRLLDAVAVVLVTLVVVGVVLGLGHDVCSDTSRQTQEQESTRQTESI